MVSERRRTHTTASGHSGVAIVFGVGVGVGLTAAAAVALYQLVKGTRPKALSEQDWRESLNNALRIANWRGVLELISQAGLDPALRREVWPFLLRVYDPESTAEQRKALHRELSQSFLDLVHRCQELETALESSVVRTGAGVAVAGGANPSQPLPAHLVQFAEAQRIIVLDAVRTKLPKVPQGPAAPPPGPGGAAEPRLNGYSNGYTGTWSAQRWCSRVGQETLASATHLTSSERAQAARLINLLSAYAVHDPETGYCQGMSDLAAPFLALFQDDTLAFWCFVQLMQTARYNFRHDESGIRSQLQALMALLQVVDPVLYHRLRQIGAGEGMFAYRMLIAMLRREMPLAQTMVLWEILWADGLLRDLPDPSTGSNNTQAATGKSGSSQHLPNGHMNGHWISHPDDSSNGPGSSGGSPGSQQGSQGPFSAGAQSSRPEPSLLLFVVASVVNAQRRAVLDDARDVDDVLRLFAGVKVEVWKTLRAARHLQRVYRSKMAEQPR